MLSCSTNHADIKESSGRTAADVARQYKYLALADYVEASQPGTRGELAISYCTHAVVSIGIIVSCMVSIAIHCQVVSMCMLYAQSIQVTCSDNFSESVWKIQIVQ